MPDPTLAKIARVRQWLRPDPRCSTPDEAELRDAVQALLDDRDAARAELAQRDTGALAAAPTKDTP